MRGENSYFPWISAGRWFQAWTFRATVFFPCWKNPLGFPLGGAVSPGTRYSPMRETQHFSTSSGEAILRVERLTHDSYRPPY